MTANQVMPKFFHTYFSCYVFYWRSNCCSAHKVVIYWEFFIFSLMNLKVCLHNVFSI